MNDFLGGKDIFEEDTRLSASKVGKKPAFD